MVNIYISYEMVDQKALKVLVIYITITARPNQYKNYLYHSFAKDIVT